METTFTIGVAGNMIVHIPNPCLSPLVKDLCLAKKLRIVITSLCKIIGVKIPTKD